MLSCIPPAHTGYEVVEQPWLDDDTVTIDHAGIIGYRPKIYVGSVSRFLFKTFGPTEEIVKHVCEHALNKIYKRIQNAA